MDKDSASVMWHSLNIIKIKEELDTYENDLKYVGRLWKARGSNEILEPYQYEIDLLRSKNS